MAVEAAARRLAVLVEVGQARRRPTRPVAAYCPRPRKYLHTQRSLQPACVTRSSRTCLQVAAIEMLFHDFDVSGDGVIDLDEFQLVMELASGCAFEYPTTQDSKQRPLRNCC